MVSGNVYFLEENGQLVMQIEGNDPSMPWRMVFSPEDAFRVGNEMSMRGLRLGNNVKMTTPAQATANAPRLPRQPQQQRPSGERGPESNVDAGSLPSAPPANASSSDDLLGDSF